MEFFEDDPSNARKVLDMLTVANEYCLFLESAEKYAKRDVFDYLLKISPLLYLKGSLLPEISPSDELFSERYVREEQWEAVFQSLKKVFGKEDVYTGHFFQDGFDNEMDNYSLAENYADIYQDLKDFVMLYQMRTYTAKENAVFQCYQLFLTHWGPRLLESLPNLHQMVYQKKTLLNDIDQPGENDLL